MRLAVRMFSPTRGGVPSVHVLSGDATQTTGEVTVGDATLVLNLPHPRTLDPEIWITYSQAICHGLAEAIVQAASEMPAQRSSMLWST